MPTPDSFFTPQTVVFITGASSGIGAAVARHLAGFGCRLGLMARRAAQLDEVARSVKQAGGDALPLAGDVTRLEDVRDACSRLATAFGPIDVAFLNAGVGEVLGIEGFTAAIVRHTLEVNVVGVANCLEVLLPEMLRRRSGTLVATSSLARYRGLPLNSAYAASKAALSTLLDGLRVEAARKGIRIVTFEPGFIKSEMTAHNRFKMPFLMETDDAAARLCRAVAAGKPIVQMPLPMALGSRALSGLPVALLDRLAARMARPR